MKRTDQPQEKKEHVQPGIAVRISGQTELLDHLAALAPGKIIRYDNQSPKHVSRVKSHTFTGYTFTKDLSLLFQKCKFHHCVFENIWAFFLDLQKCEFINCEFRNSRFSHAQPGWNELIFRDCYFRNIEFDEGYMANTIFERCYIVGLDLIGQELFNTHFLDCHIENSQFQSVVYYPPDYDIADETADDVVFSNCDIQFCYFATSDFRNSSFHDSTLYLCAFINCVLANESIISENKNLAPNYASLDFQTILKSELTDPVILQNYFNIQLPDVKAQIEKISSRIAFKKVFISYSFKDKDFAVALNKILNKNGIKTFLWEKDAPGGAYLEDIMSQNVRDHDTLLFIASENSIKSKACQFELSEGRKKQEETWNNVFFPIHIDNYIFEVRQNQIRPISKASEYWDNIEELKRINSKDFTNFSDAGAVYMSTFEHAVLNQIVDHIRST
ncbi:MAG: TIR domain-containing protein [Sphingobacteriaceae bacterium]|nr:TIR domain-containing protein [Sphingobacteriaceae bacterium]